MSERDQARSAAGGPREFTTSQLKLIRRTLARACTDSEFDEFIAVASLCNLDPLRRQITPLILSPEDPRRRRLVCWATIDGLRVIAARQGDYRPMETAPIIEVDPSRIDPDTNPCGIVRAEVRAWKSSGQDWHPVAGEAWWDEYAPLRDADGGDHRGGASASAAGAPHSERKKMLDGAWRRMGRVMIAKCAEAQALRRGWPDIMAGLYGEEELHALRLHEQTASDLLRKSDEERLRHQIAKRTLWFIFAPGGAFEPVKMENAFERLRTHYESADSKREIETFQTVNRSSLLTLWEWSPGEALALKQICEATFAQLSKARPAEAASEAKAPRQDLERTWADRPALGEGA